MANGGKTLLFDVALFLIIDYANAGVRGPSVCCYKEARLEGRRRYARKLSRRTGESCEVLPRPQLVRPPRLCSGQAGSPQGGNIWWYAEGVRLK